MKAVILNGKEIIDMVCLKKGLDQLIRQVDGGKIEPYKMMVWADHPVVVDITKSLTIRIDRPGKDTILFPVAKKGKELVIYNGKEYGAFGLKEEINLTACVK